MSTVHGTPKGGVSKLCLTEKLWLLKHFNYKHLLNKKSEFISKCRHEKKLLVKSAGKGQFYLYLYCCIILVFVTKYFYFVFRKLRKRFLKIVENTQSSIMNHKSKLTISFTNRLSVYIYSFFYSFVYLFRCRGKCINTQINSFLRNLKLKKTYERNLTYEIILDAKISEQFIYEQIIQKFYLDSSTNRKKSCKAFFSKTQQNVSLSQAPYN